MCLEPKLSYFFALFLPVVLAESSSTIASATGATETLSDSNERFLDLVVLLSEAPCFFNRKYRSQQSAPDRRIGSPLGVNFPVASALARFDQLLVSLFLNDSSSFLSSSGVQSLLSTVGSRVTFHLVKCIQLSVFAAMNEDHTPTTWLGSHLLFDPSP
jgi:hypothetical protein